MLCAPSCQPCIFLAACEWYMSFSLLLLAALDAVQSKRAGTRAADSGICPTLSVTLQLGMHTGMSSMSCLFWSSVPGVSTQFGPYAKFFSSPSMQNTVVGVQVSKDVDSGITHYVCIHVASEVTTKAARELDPTSPVALPKLPNGMAETPTARSATTLTHHAATFSHHAATYTDHTATILPMGCQARLHGLSGM